MLRWNQLVGFFHQVVKRSDCDDRIQLSTRNIAEYFGVRGTIGDIEGKPPFLHLLQINE